MNRILIVDDEPVCTLFLGLHLRDKGYIVETAEDGATAVEKASTFNPEILISDWILKDTLDGIDVAHTIIKHNPKLKIIFMTGMAAESLNEKIENLPYYKILEKPIDLDKLQNLITTYLIT